MGCSSKTTEKEESGSLSGRRVKINRRVAVVMLPGSQLGRSPNACVFVDFTRNTLFVAAGETDQFRSAIKIP